MARTRPDDRLERLVTAAAEVFTSLGYRRTMMADVAKALGVAPGTLYLYVESKEALFDLVVRHAYPDAPSPRPSPLPVRTPAPGETLKTVANRIAAARPLASLDSALTSRRVVDARGEIAGILRELYRMLSSYRSAIKLIDRCAPDFPELAAIWFKQGRGDLMDRLTRYLDLRTRAGHFKPLADTAVAARVLLETVVLFAIHRHWDPAPQAMEDQTVEDTLVRLLVDGLSKEQPG